MPGKRKLAGKALGPIARAARRAAHFDAECARATTPDARVRVRGEHLAAVIRHAPPGLAPLAAEQALTAITALIADIERLGIPA
jgi:hypothetical protein